MQPGSSQLQVRIVAPTVSLLQPAFTTPDDASSLRSAPNLEALLLSILQSFFYFIEARSSPPASACPTHHRFATMSSGRRGRGGFEGGGGNAHRGTPNGTAVSRGGASSRGRGAGSQGPATKYSAPRGQSSNRGQRNNTPTPKGPPMNSASPSGLQGDVHASAGSMYDLLYLHTKSKPWTSSGRARQGQLRAAMGPSPGRPRHTRALYQHRMLSAPSSDIC